MSPEKPEDTRVTREDLAEKIIAGYQSRDQRAMPTTFSDCYYPTGHFIAFQEDSYFASTLVDPH